MAYYSALVTGKNPNCLNTEQLALFQPIKREHIAFFRYSTITWFASQRNSTEKHKGYQLLSSRLSQSRNTPANILNLNVVSFNK